ncbi:PLC-like phosphodiesterase [Calycina marina]|uniref:PLC-like phosphodiesterase n=1 Tax=Calycina marina TaxID=1763456 RepID=A0A9P7Z232_9HELO|nr:PLC-like phosphodiesterase [Calycina marina]
MPSKGIDCYSYIGAEGCQIHFSVPGQNLVKNQLKQYVKDHLEVDKHNIEGIFDFTGDFSFKVLFNGNQITRQSVEVNALTGTLGKSTMTNMENQTSIVTKDHIVCYGFYDSGPGVAGLPSSDQCYVTVTPNHSNWQGHVAPPGSPQAAKPFAKLFLPAAHDIGMNAMQTCNALLASSALVEVLTKINPVFSKVVGTMSHAAARAMAPAIISGLAITQKDTLPTILSTGARYFEFRPAYLHKDIRGNAALPDTLYFSHSAIPGMAYEVFLRDVVSFLMAHPSEIVVVQNRGDGVPGDCHRPTDPELLAFLKNALSAAHGSIVGGSLEDIRNLTIQQLRDQKKRLVVGANWDSFSTYTDQGNATVNGKSILAEFEQLSSSPQKSAGKPFSNLQCQATATNLPEVVAYSVIAANTSNSCLLATKPICDSKTLLWLKNNGGRLDANQLQVVMNDFFDGATADICVDWSRRRLA